jgi:hypothetical protein
MTKTTQVPVHTQKEQNSPRLQHFVNRGAVGLAAAGTGSLAMAAYDVTDIITNLGLAVTAAATIGVAWLGFTAGIAIWRNLRAAAK